MTQQHSTASPVHSQFPVWRTIQIGTGLKTANDFRRALTSAGYRIGTWANDILGRFTPATEEKKLDLVAVSVAELGFANGATLRDIYARAKELGLELCPAEVGPQLRLQYSEQLYGEWLFIAMEAISVSDGNPSIFDVVHIAFGRWLFAYYGGPGGFWIGSFRFVFVRRN